MTPSIDLTRVTLSARELIDRGIDPETAAQVEKILRTCDGSPVAIALLDAVAENLLGH
jgi:hypothetical protein